MTACFDRDGNRVEPEGVCPVYDTGSVWPTFALVKPAIDNTRVDMSPYGQSVFADAVDAIQAVDLCYDAMMSEIDNGKMRVFLSDVMFDVERDGKGGRVSIPFGRQDCTVFRKVMSTEDTINEFAPTLRTEAQARAFRVALQTLGDLCGFGINYFDLENVGYVKTATEVSADNSALMRNIRRHERALEGAIAGICRALMAAERGLGVELPDEGLVRVAFDDSIITDTTAEKRQDMDEVAAGLLEPWEYRAKWRGEDEATARTAARSGPSAAGLGRRLRRERTALYGQRTAEAAPRGDGGWLDVLLVLLAIHCFGRRICRQESAGTLSVSGTLARDGDAGGLAHAAPGHVAEPCAEDAAHLGLGVDADVPLARMRHPCVHNRAGRCRLPRVTDDKGAAGREHAPRLECRALGVRVVVEGVVAPRGVERAVAEGQALGVAEQDVGPLSQARAGRLGHPRRQVHAAEARARDPLEHQRGEGARAAAQVMLPI